MFSSIRRRRQWFDAMRESTKNNPIGMEPIRQMCSYSHRDRPLMMRLHEHLSVLRREKLIVHWWDREIGPGKEWKGVIDEHLETAQIILFLVSPSFLASDYCY